MGLTVPKEVRSAPRLCNFCQSHYGNHAAHALPGAVLSEGRSRTKLSCKQLINRPTGRNTTNYQDSYDKIYNVRGVADFNVPMVFHVRYVFLA